MRNLLFRFTLSIAAALLLNFAYQGAVFAQGPGDGPPPFAEIDPAKRVGGQITEISSSAIKIKNREGAEETVTVTAQTVYSRNREDATLAAFKVSDFIIAIGSRDANGQFTAERVLGGDRPPRGAGRPGGRFRGIGGEVAAVDASAGTITVKNRDGETQTIYTTAQTAFNRNRQAAALSDFKAGDHVRAEGSRNDSGQFIASRIFGGDQRPDR